MSAGEQPPVRKRPSLAELVVLDGTEVEDCDHVDTGRVRKYDGGRCPLLCARCYTIVGRWSPADDEPSTT